MDNHPPKSSTSETTPKRIVHTGIPTINIKQQFLVAASHLKSGYLVKDESLTLFEAVGALEIGDAKMDSGFLEPGETLEDDYSVTDEITPEQAIWLMDELFYREAAWHTGYPLSQTLFTSLYIDALLWPDPTSLANATFDRVSSVNEQPPLLYAVFRAYCLSVVKCCDLFLSVVTSQHYYEEEDLATQTFNRELLHKFDTHEIVELVEAAQHWLSTCDLEIGLRDALGDRLRFRQLFLEMLDTTQPNTLLNAHLALDAVKRIAKDDHQGKPVPAAFSTKVQRKLASTVPPRPMIAVERAKAFLHFEKLCTDLGDAQAVLTTTCGKDLLTATWCLLAQTPQPSVYVRAFIQSRLNQNGQILGRYILDDFFFQDIKLLIKPVEPLLVQQTRPSPMQTQVKDMMNIFLAKCSPSYLNIFKCFCLNRPRVRRTLCHAIVEWDQMQVDAEDTDGTLSTIIGEEPHAFPPGAEASYSFPLSSWIYHHKLSMMELTIQMGFELSVYQPYELKGLFWYLSYICGVHLAHLERISFFASKSNPTSNLKHKSAHLDELDTTLKYLYRHFREVKAVDALAQALHILYAILERHECFPKPQSTYSSDHLQYELRMRPFLHVAVPEALSFEDFSEMVKVEEVSDEELLDRAASYCNESKKAWEDMLKDNWHALPLHIDGEGHSQDSAVKREWKRQVQNSMKSVIATSVSISSLRNALKKNGKEDAGQVRARVPDVDTPGRWHPFWPVPVIER